MFDDEVPCTYNQRMNVQTFDMVDVGPPSGALEALFDKHDLTQKQANFVQLYVHYDAMGRNRQMRWKIVEAAGYSTKRARAAYGELINHPRVLAAIRDLYDEQARGSVLSAGQVVRGLGAVAVGNIADFISIGRDGLPRLDMSAAEDDQMATIKSMKSKTVTVTNIDTGTVTETHTAELTMHDKLKALTVLGRYHRLEPQLQDEKPPETNDKLEPRDLAMAIMSGISGMVEDLKHKETIDVATEAEIVEEGQS